MGPGVGVGCEGVSYLLPAQVHPYLVSSGDQVPTQPRS